MSFPPLGQNQVCPTRQFGSLTHDGFVRVWTVVDRLDKAANKPGTEPDQRQRKKYFAATGTMDKPAVQKPRHQRGRHKRQAGQGRIDVDFALAAAQAEKQEHQNDPAKQDQPRPSCLANCLRHAGTNHGSARNMGSQYLGMTMTKKYQNGSLCSQALA